ncbi:hypothetical protein SUGI_0392490 [Cryptomeria japonica]|nr:hypothetical protein SUGI_0392490 [Cryptomeria japonica]
MVDTATNVFEEFVLVSTKHEKLTRRQKSLSCRAGHRAARTPAISALASLRSSPLANFGKLKSISRSRVRRWSSKPQDNSSRLWELFCCWDSSVSWPACNCIPCICCPACGTTSIGLSTSSSAAAATTATTASTILG